MKSKNEERKKKGFSIDKDSELTQEMASNILTILNAAKSLHFNSRNFDNCEIPYANLSD